ncbi:hypothetical protein H311_03741 [Anncaliia algerae PRA109]|nr:hypothetical protein H311_03741 [Anncaliia algerae PRA109]
MIFKDKDFREILMNKTNVNNETKEILNNYVKLHKNKETNENDYYFLYNIGLIILIILIIIFIIYFKNIYKKYFKKNNYHFVTFHNEN